MSYQGEWLPPSFLKNFSVPPKIQKESDQSQLSNLKFRWGKVSRPIWRVRGGGLVATREKNKVAILKKIHAKYSKNLQNMLESSFSFFISHRQFCAKIFNFCLYFTENLLFWARLWLWRHSDVILGILLLILVCNEKSRPKIYYGTN